MNKVQNSTIRILPSKIKNRIEEAFLQKYLRELASESLVLLKEYAGYGDDEFEYEVTLIEKKEEVAVVENSNKPNSVDILYIHPSRIDELRGIKSKWDILRLIRLCEEVNISAANNCILAVIALVRTITNFVPPIFGYKSFEEVAAHHKGRSAKKNLKNLFDSMKNISDHHLHAQANKVDSLPNMTQANFSADLDVLLQETSIALKKSNEEQ